MKTLDEVIKALETDPVPMAYTARLSVHEDIMTDALHYLKVLKDILDPLKVKKISHEITCPQCNSVIAILLPESNEPLTWEELKTMEGKPVWVELYGSDFDEWVLIHAWNDDIMWFADCNGTLYTEKECRLGQTWQAYRKERE